MISIDLHPDRTTCAETLARREYDRLWREALGSPDPAPGLDLRVETLRLFLESTDFAALRAACERDLAAGRAVTVTVTGDGTEAGHTIRSRFTPGIPHEPPLPRRILVTGAAGFLGAATVRRLAARPEVEQVVATDRRPDPGLGGGKVRWCHHDLTAPGVSLLEEHPADAVVHHAYLVRTTRDEAAARRINVDATADLIGSARRAGVARIVYPSSTTVYGARPGTGLHTEDETPRPVPGFTYSEHKVEAERLLLDAGDVDVVILRACVVTGPGTDSFILSSLSLPILPVPRGSDPEMQFLHLDDYLTAVEAALVTPATGIYNIAGRDPVPLHTLARALGNRTLALPERMLRAIVELSWRSRLQNRSAGNGLAFITHPWVASTARIEREMGWRPRLTSLEAIRAWAANE